MALKRLKTKKSKRIPARQKYKILKKIREHNRKVRKEAKNNPKSKSRKHKLVQIPNICPFKEEILREVEAAKKRQEEEKQRRREMLKRERDINKFSTLESLADDSEMRGTLHGNVHGGDREPEELKWMDGIGSSEICELIDPNLDNICIQEAIFINLPELYNRKAGDLVIAESTYIQRNKKELSLKTYYKEFKKVIENADVILEVVDARDPLGTRCKEVQEVVESYPGKKRLIVILNKADLVPRENLNKWIKYFRQFSPVSAFKASTQDQSNKLGRRKFHQMNTDKALQSSVCVGADLLMSMLANYCRNKGMKTSIRVGVVGIPNVGKSSVINSLTRGKTCTVGCTPGVTKVMQEVELDSKIKLLDCPGIVFSSQNSSKKMSAVLKNAQKVSDVEDPFSVADSILQRASKEYFCKLYDITEYESYEEFFAKKAARMGKFLRGGVPDVLAAARSVLNDWNTGKIKYCTQPPEFSKDAYSYLSSSIVHENVREFEVENFDEMEGDILNKFDVKEEEIMEIASIGPANVRNKSNENEMTFKHPTIMEAQIKPKKRKLEAKDKFDPAMHLEGNQMINKSLKDQQKRRKKVQARNEKKISNVADVLENFTIAPQDDTYNFESDYEIKE